MPRFLTFDLGTTLFKVALFDDSGKLLDLERAVPPTTSPRPGWFELDPMAFMETVARALGRLRSRQARGLDDLAAVAIATQANSFLLTDDSDRPITPFILWSDQRACGEDLTLLQRLAPGAGPLLALAKLLWLRRHQPDVIAKARRLIFIGDYLLQSRATEAGAASLARICHPHESAQPDLNRLNALQLSQIQMPHILQAGTDLGPGVFAPGLGIPETTHVVLGCLDQYAGAIGTGTVSPGQICETTGTVLAAVRCDDHLDPDPAPDVFQGPGFAPDRFFQMSFSSTSANLLEHYRNILPDEPSFEDLAREASAADDDVIIEPYQDGKSIESCFAHVQKHHTRGRVVRGIMHCVAQALKQQVQSLSPGELPSEIRSAGGGAKSDLWLQMKADLLGIPFVALECEEPTSLGAAILAAHGIGMGSVEEIARKWVRVRKTFLPNARATKP